MSLSAQLSKHFYQVHFGGNWTISNYFDLLSDVSYEESIVQIGELNTILRLTNHTSYFLPVARKVLEGGPLVGKDSESFDYIHINGEEEWQNLLAAYWENAKTVSSLIEQLPEERLTQPFFDGKYGNYFRNLNGMIEHAHYHLGQIALIKKMIRSSK